MHSVTEVWPVFWAGRVDLSDIHWEWPDQGEETKLLLWADIMRVFPD